MLEVLATVLILAIGCMIEATLTTIAMKVNLKVVDKKFQHLDSESTGENS